jgi:hypothetical protein
VPDDPLLLTGTLRRLRQLVAQLRQSLASSLNKRFVESLCFAVQKPSNGFAWPSFKIGDERGGQ